MAINQRILYVILLSSLLIFPLLASAQTFDIDSVFPQQATISNSGFFPFSNISNNAFQDQFPKNMSLEATFTNFLGGPCTIAPAANFAEIGPSFTVTGNSNFLLDFSMASQVDTFGLSFAPQGSPCTFNLLIMTPIVSSSSGSTSTSGGAVKTNEELISEAISLETTVNNNLSSNNPSFEDEISDLAKSLDLLNELSANISDNSSSISTKVIQKKITCATNIDNQVSTILGSLQEGDSPDKAKKLLKKALRCKKTIKRKI